MSFDLKQPLFGIYLHWPYCARICPYCDFNVYAAKSRRPDELVEAFQRDIDHQAKRTGEKQLTSVYFGGGTPSLIPADQIEALQSFILSNWTSDDQLEITLEANPEDVTPDALRAWKDAGINRISLGIQSLKTDDLKFLGRQHTADEAKRAAEHALSVFDNVSLDLIYARPGQSIDDWLAELSETLALGAPHLSLYELTIKEKTAFEKQVERALFTPLDEDAQADLYLETLKQTAKAGLPAYEVSNHARSEAFQSRHNLTYWLGGDWLGIGPGAEGRFSTNGERHMTRGLTRPADYMKSLSEGQSGLESDDVLSREAEADEYLIMGLRSRFGIEQEKIEALYGRPLNAGAIARFEDTGHLTRPAGRICLTEDGWLLADYIVSQILPDEPDAN